MADSLWFADRCVPGVGRQIEVWLASSPKDCGPSVRFTWKVPSGPAHVELHAYVRHARMASRALRAVLGRLELRDIANPSPEQLLRVLRGGPS